MAPGPPENRTASSVVFPSGSRRLILDFDGTLILEHLLTAWVRFLLRHSGWPAGRRLAFLVKSLARGAAAMILSRCPAGEALSVRTAFGAFRGVEEESLAALVRHRKARPRPGGIYALNLNPAVMSILEHLAASVGRAPPMEIVSRGSSREAVRRFLAREDVRRRLESMGISPDAIAVHANDMETDGAGRYTGAIRGNALLKWNRMEKMPRDALFIGDAEDERILRRGAGRCRAAFLNWRQWKGAEQKY